MTPAIRETIDEICTSNTDILHVQDLEEFKVWVEFLGYDIRHLGLRFEYPNFSQYSTPQGMKFYWPLVEKRIKELK